jgi:hypothetical protein
VGEDKGEGEKEVKLGSTKMELYQERINYSTL